MTFLTWDRPSTKLGSESGPTWFYLVLLGSTWFYLVLLGSTWFYLALLGSTWFYLVLLDYMASVSLGLGHQVTGSGPQATSTSAPRSSSSTASLTAARAAERGPRWR